MSTTQRPPPSSRRKSVVPSVFGVVDLASTVAKESANRAALYVAAMENYLGIHFDRKVQLLAMAAVSGLAVSTAIAAKAGSVPPSPNITRVIAETDKKHGEKYSELERQYQNLRREHDTMVSDSTLSGQEMLSFRQEQDRTSAKHAEERQEADESLAKCLAQLQVYEKQQKEAEEIVSSAVSKVTRLEEELSATKEAHERETDQLKDKMVHLQNISEARSVQLQSLQTELHDTSIVKQKHEESLEAVRSDFNAKSLDLEAAKAREGDLLKQHRESVLAHDSQISDTNNTLIRHQSRIDSLVAQNIELAQRLDTREQELHRVEAEHDSSREALVLQKADHAILQAELSNAIQDLENSKENYRSQIVKLQQEFHKIQQKHAHALQQAERSPEIYRSELQESREIISKLTQEKEHAFDQLSTSQLEQKTIEKEQRAAVEFHQRTVSELRNELEQATAATSRIEQQILNEHADLMHAKSWEMSQAEEAHNHYIRELNELHDYELNMLNSELQDLRVRLSRAEANVSELRSSSTKQSIREPTTNQIRMPSTGSTTSEAFEQSNREISSLDVQERSLARFRASEIFDSQRDSRNAKSMRASSTSQRTVSNDRQSVSQSLWTEHSTPAKQLGKSIVDDDEIEPNRKGPSSRRSSAAAQSEQMPYKDTPVDETTQQSRIPTPSNPPSPSSRQRSVSSTIRLTPVQTDTRTPQSSRFVEGSPVSPVSTPAKERGFRGLFRRASGKFKASPENAGKPVTGRLSSTEHPPMPSPHAAQR